MCYMTRLTAAVAEYKRTQAAYYACTAYGTNEFNQTHNAYQVALHTVALRAELLIDSEERKRQDQAAKDEADMAAAQSRMVMKGSPVADNNDPVDVYPPGTTFDVMQLTELGYGVFEYRGTRLVRMVGEHERRVCALDAANHLNTLHETGHVAK